jgi:DNA-binding Lrp family transcriptional regulator
MTPFEQQVGAHHDPAVRRAYDRGVVARTELDRLPLGEPPSEALDNGELPQITNTDDPPPSKTGYGGRPTVHSPPGEDVMVQAYILIQTEVGKAADVAREISGLTGVTQAEDVTGPYDVIVRAEARDVDELGKLVVARIQTVEGITRTLTCPIVHI